MISDWQVDTIYFSQLLSSKYPQTYSKIVETLMKIGVVPLLLSNTRDIWARDYMPIQIDKDTFIEFRYDPDYLQGDILGRRGIKSYPDIVCDSIGLKTVKTDIILDGGNVVKASNAVILTDKVVHENRHHYSKTNLIKRLHELFEVSKVILIPWDKGCEFGHSDGMLRFIDDYTVLISGYYESFDPDFKHQLLKPLINARFNIEWLRCSEKEAEKHIAYINFLQTKDFVLVPSLMNEQMDKIAIEQISKIFPQYAKENRIAQVDLLDVTQKGGALNCISWTIKQY